ncbi:MULTISPECIES: AraC family transcriptional regulator [unclassified Pseudomonas]|uniref:AraC family transcriptional regulator n=1 Tax=unclassified Pseudomonas TaxID=196821 RepID=UPI000C87F4E8|nr:MULTISPECIES: AraC family transcriptional regulator [unclassified Pseudomonas]PMX27469.1 AraC family transcriptional regulator [Pseudomonas sp. GW460-12]PMX34463.1 AraC family transcriptional regulator [Pseudomonas sp. MPR-R2A4]PMX41870.1 AraC family transcriptional regulator [Pseudomonas sp. MPR-R2A7]PMX53826.1 AraC family transcriptional regulator [Pseudomonas sp. MPR-R2A6]PMX91307.1 AraC family transcriptional regulator [Pseudomonas sp. MPR-R2A3]
MSHRTYDSETIPISSQYSRLLAREIGIGEKQLPLLLRGTGIQAVNFINDDILLTPKQQITIGLNAYAISGDEGLGLRVGKLLTPEIYGPLGFLVSACPDLGTALEHFISFLPSHISLASLSTSTDDNWIIFKLGLRYTDHEIIRRAAVESISLSLLSLIEAIIGKELDEGRLCCSYPPPSYHKSFARYYRLPVEFNAADDRLYIPKSLAAYPNLISSKANYLYALKICQSMSGKISTRGMTTKERVAQLLLSAPPGTFTEDSVAESLLISKRTLIRRLTEENTTYKTIRDRLLSNIAASQLLETTDSIDSIATLLDYHDSSNFRRAFKKWFMMTPEQFRKQKRKP